MTSAGTRAAITPGGAPITVAITRRVPVHRTREMASWVRTGTDLAAQFPGFLGAGWIRPGDTSSDWHMLYRFRDADALAGWEGSEERGWWLSTGQDLVEHTRVQRRTGIEGWFDEPTSVDVEVADEPPPATAPPRWKQAVSIWLGFFPVNLAASWLVAPTMGDWHVVLRTFVLTVLMTPVMVYLVLPRVTGWLEPWLRR